MKPESLFPGEVPFLRTDQQSETLDNILSHKPQDSIARLICTLQPEARHLRALRPRPVGRRGAEIYLLTQGCAHLHRRSDGLLLSIVQAPHVLGLAELILPLAIAVEVRFSADAEVWLLSAPSFHRVVATSPMLWADVATVLAFHLHYTSWRDLHLLSDSAYSIIRGKLFELARLPEPLRAGTTIERYVLSTTCLGRSTVLRILKALVTGGYITTRRGVLLSVRMLPQRF